MKNCTIILIICWLFTGCEQETIVDPSIKYMSHKLSVSATLDTDGGQFQAHIYKTRPISEHGWRYEDTPDIRKGRVMLHEDGIPVLDTGTRCCTGGIFLYQYNKTGHFEVTVPINRPI